MLSFDFFSPIEPIHLAHYADKQLTVHLKRDDCIHPFISGNKWRKLKYTLMDAQKKQKTHLVTFGGPWSNHLLATACAAAKFGFKSTAYVRGEAVNNPNLQLCKLFGMSCIFINRMAYRDKPHLFQAYHGSDTQAYFIDEGGFGPEAVKGCAEIIDEILQETYDHIFCACGTGTTIAGLSLGLKKHRLPTQLHGVPVLAGGDFLHAEIAQLAPQARVILHTEFHFGGYAKTKPELLTFIQHFVAQTGILIEPVYTGKLFYALHQLITQQYFEPNSKILVLHTGGLTGILGKLDEF